MAASSEGEVTAEVQAYLDKHRISNLFQELMSKIVKELPTDPVEFLISKLQILHRRKKATSPRPPTTSAASSRSKIQITGTSVTPKPAATGKSASAERLIKSSGNIRLAATKSKSTLASTSSPSLTKGTHPSSTKTHPPRHPTTVTTPTRPLSKTTGSTKLRAATHATRRPTTAPTAGKASTRVAATTSKSGKSPSDTRPAARGKAATKGGVAAVEPSQEKEEVTKRASSSEEIDEFFGEAKKLSSRQLQSVSDEEEEVPVSSRRGEAGEWSDDEGDRDRGRGERRESPSRGMVLDLFARKRMSSKQAKKAHHEKLQSLLASSPEAQTVTPTSSGYISDVESGEEGEEGIVMVEDYAALEEEGVTGLKKGKYTLREAAPLGEGATVDIQVLICARCAKVLTDGDRGTDISSSEITQVTQSGEGAFESASQVGSHAPFPQWDTGSAIGSELSAMQKSGDSASNVTLQSHDTWGGLAPQPRPQVPPSDDESEIQLPPPPPLDGRPWVQDPPPERDPHGWGQEGSKRD